MKQKIHRIGKHGAIGFLTKQGLICSECGKKIKEKSRYLNKKGKER